MLTLAKTDLEAESTVLDTVIAQLERNLKLVSSSSCFKCWYAMQPCQPNLIATNEMSSEMSELKDVALDLKTC